MTTEPLPDKWQPPPSSMESIDASYKWWSLTHFFLEWNEDEDWIYPCFGIIPYQEDTLQAAYKNRNFHKLEIFGFDVENRDERRFNLLVNMEKAFVHFFKEVFEIKSFEKGYHYSFDLCRIGLPQQKYNEIMKLISKHGLAEVWELIFFIIAKAQSFYNDHVRFCESKEEKAKVRNINMEVVKAIDLVERIEKEHDVFSDQPKERDKLLRINFIFQKDKSIQIKDPLLVYEFVKHFKEHYDNCYYKDWRLQLELTPYQYEESKQREQFRFRYAIALHNFLTKTTLIKTEKDPLPNNLMECILDIVELSLIKVGKPEHTKAHKIKIIRNWVQDHQLKPDITFEKIQPDINKLYNYFDKDFIDCADEIKRADAIKNGLFLCLQFKTQPLQNEMIHLTACLREWHWRISQQLETGPIIPENPLPKEYDAFKIFVNNVVADQKLDKVTFKMADDEKTYELTDRLPIYFLQTAVRNHYKDHREDYETDILQAEIKNGKEPGSFSSKTTGHFNLPEDRFFIRFTASFFNFLQNEGSPLEKEYKPADRYYSLIAKALQITGYFRDMFPEDWYLKSKVEYWHSLVKQ